MGSGPEHLPSAGTSCGACWRWRGARASGRSRTTGRYSSSCCPPASTPSRRAARTPSAPCRPARATSVTSWTTARSASTAWVSPAGPERARSAPGARPERPGGVVGALRGRDPGDEGVAPRGGGARPGCWRRGRARAPRGGACAALGPQLQPRPLSPQAVPSLMPPTPCQPPGCTAACTNSLCLPPPSIPSCAPASPATPGGFSASAAGEDGRTGQGTPRHTGGQRWLTCASDC